MSHAQSVAALDEEDKQLVKDLKSEIACLRALRNGLNCAVSIKEKVSGKCGTRAQNSTDIINSLDCETKRAPVNRRNVKIQTSAPCSEDDLFQLCR